MVGKFPIAASPLITFVQVDVSEFPCFWFRSQQSQGDDFAVFWMCRRVNFVQVNVPGLAQVFLVL